MASEPVSEDEAQLFGALLKRAMEEWVDRTGRDELPDELAEKVLAQMGWSAAEPEGSQ